MADASITPGDAHAVWGFSSCVSQGREPALRRIAHATRRGVRPMRPPPLGVLARAGPRERRRDPQAPASSPRYADSNEPRFRRSWMVEVAGSPGNSVPVAYRTKAPNAGRRGDATAPERHVCGGQISTPRLRRSSRRLSTRRSPRVPRLRRSGPGTVTRVNGATRPRRLGHPAFLLVVALGLLAATSVSSRTFARPARRQRKGRNAMVPPARATERGPRRAVTEGLGFPKWRPRMPRPNVANQPGRTRTDRHFIATATMRCPSNGYVVPAAEFAPRHPCRCLGPPRLQMNAWGPWL
jgi:hypothetical protein